MKKTIKGLEQQLAASQDTVKHLRARLEGIADTLWDLVEPRVRDVASEIAADAAADAVVNLSIV